MRSALESGEGAWLSLGEIRRELVALDI